MSRDSVGTRASMGGSQERRREEAARWFVTLQHAQVSERLLKIWKKWEAIPENREAFDAIERIWHVTDYVPGLPIATAEERADDHYNGSVPIPTWLSAQAAASAAASTASPRRRFAFRTFGLAAAAVVIALVTVPRIFQPFIQSFMTTQAPERTVVVETGLGEHKQIVFEDGTRIHLGAQTSVTASFTKSTRSVVLDRGEAHFRVAKDAQRPFEVNAGSGTITAVGTAFVVQHRQDSDVVVTVTEGTVEVAPVSTHPAPNGDAPDIGERPAVQRVVRGQEVTYDAQGNISPIRLTEVESFAAWLNGRFRYTSEPLKHVIEDINRYSSRQLILDDSVAGEFLYSGIVFESDIDEWVSGLERTFPQIEIVTSDNAHVLIRARAAAETTQR